jgi:hypothetical protein
MIGLSKVSASGGNATRRHQEHEARHEEEVAPRRRVCLPNRPFVPGKGLVMDLGTDILPPAFVLRVLLRVVRAFVSHLH